MATNQIATGALGAGQGALSGGMAGAAWGAAGGPIGAAGGAIIGTVIGGLSGVLSGAGSNAAKKGLRAQKRAIRAEGKARMRDLYKDYSKTIGLQRVGYAAGGVIADAGTAALAQEETRDTFARNQGLTAYLTKQKEKGAEAGHEAGRASLAAGYTSDLMQLSQMAYSFGSGRPTPKPDNTSGAL